MFGARLRGLLLFAAVSSSMLTAANSAAIGPVELNREAVDERSYSWSSIGKLFNETGGSCSGVVISRDKVLTAAHCLYNYRAQRFIPADSLHFLVGYRSGRYSAHARVARYEIGAGFDPRRYDQTSEADWAVLTVTENLPPAIEPLRLRRDVAPSGTKAVIAGYAQDRAFAMTADRDCELRDKIEAGRFLLHTCRSTRGYSGAPILVRTGGNEMQIAGMQIASVRRDGTESMIALPAQSIWVQGQEKIVEASAVCIAAAYSTTLDEVHARLDWEETDIVSSIPAAAEAPSSAAAWLALETEPFSLDMP